MLSSITFLRTQSAPSIALPFVIFFHILFLPPHRSWMKFRREWIIMKTTAATRIENHAATHEIRNARALFPKISPSGKVRRRFNGKILNYSKCGDSKLFHFPFFFFFFQSSANIDNRSRPLSLLERKLSAIYSRYWFVFYSINMNNSKILSNFSLREKILTTARVNFQEDRCLQIWLILPNSIKKINNHNSSVKFFPRLDLCWTYHWTSGWRSTV